MNKLGTADQGHIVAVDETTALYISRPDDLPPQCLDGAVPVGWWLTGEVLDLSLTSAPWWAEAWVLERMSE